MSEKLIIPQVLTSPMPWGVKVEWKWPEGSHWFSKLEMQYLHSDGRLEKQVIGWPVTGKAIGGLKAGERLQIRLRPIDKNGAVREWTQGDWIEGVSSSNAEEYLAAFSITAGSDMRLMTSFVAPKFKIENGEVFINDAFISEAITAAANLTEKAVTKDDKFNADKVLEEAWKCGFRSIAEGIDALAKAVTAYPQDYKQHIVGGETSASTYSVSMGINLNDVQLASGVGINIDGILKNALAHDKAMSDFEEAIRKAIHKESLPGGLIWGQCVASAVHTALASLDKDNASPR